MDYHSLEDTHKKAAARRAAAKYATEPPHALREYIRLSGIIDLLPDAYKECPPYKHYIENGEKAEAAHTVAIWVSDKDYFEELKKTNPARAESAQIYADADKEMLSLLPGYRYPVNDIIAENMIFFTPGKLDMTLTGFIWTPLMMEVKESVSEPMRSKILEDLKRCELAKGELNCANQELLELRDLFDKAREVYQPFVDGERPDKRNARVVEVLGLSIGKRQKRYIPGDLYTAYVRLIRHEGLSRKDATSEVANTFCLSENTVLNSLYDTLSHIKKQWRQDSPQLYKSKIKKYFTGLVLPKGDWNL